jgi:hypothetical protein
MLDLSTFAEEYILIKTHQGFKTLDSRELKKISEYQRMTEQGYSLKLIKSRLGSKLSWLK